MKVRPKSLAQVPPEYFWRDSHSSHALDSPTTLDTECPTCARAIAESPESFVPIEGES